LIKTRDVADVGVDLPCFWVDGEEDGAIVTMALGEDLAKLRKHLFRTILLVAGDEDDMFTLAGALAAFKNKEVFRGQNRGGRDNRGEEQGVARHAIHDIIPWV